MSGAAELVLQAQGLGADLADVLLAIASPPAVAAAGGAPSGSDATRESGDFASSNGGGVFSAEQQKAVTEATRIVCNAERVLCLSSAGKRASLLRDAQKERPRGSARQPAAAQQRPPKAQLQQQTASGAADSPATDSPLPSSQTSVGSTGSAARRRRGDKNRKDRTVGIGPDADIFELLHSPDSPLSMVDLRQVVSYNAFQTLTNDQKNSILPLLANRDRESEDSIRSLFFSPAFHEALETFQSALQSGALNVSDDRYLPEWVTARHHEPPEESMYRPNARLNNQWKGKHFEEYWGQRKKPASHDADLPEAPPFRYPSNDGDKSKGAGEGEDRASMIGNTGTGRGADPDRGDGIGNERGDDSSDSDFVPNDEQGGKRGSPFDFDDDSESSDFLPEVSQPRKRARNEVL